MDDCEISIQGYSAFLFRLLQTWWRGYVKSLFTCSIPFKGTAEFECIIINVACFVNPCAGSDVSICLFYRPPDSAYSLLDTLFRHFPRSENLGKILSLHNINHTIIQEQKRLCTQFTI